MFIYVFIKLDHLSQITELHVLGRLKVRVGAAASILDCLL